MRPIVLASGSARRLDLLRQVGLEPSVQVPVVDETAMPGEAPGRHVERLARAKATAVPAPIPSLVIAADTVIAFRGQIYGKPPSRAAAISMLEQFSGRKHRVFSGLALRLCPENRLYSEVTTTDVFFRKLDREEIISYVSEEEILGCAGAYRIQERGVFLLEKIVGSYSNVVGLPLETLYRMCRRLGIHLMVQ